MKFSPEESMNEVFRSLNLDTTKPDLKKTPTRWLNGIRELVSGYSIDPGELLSVSFDTGTPYGGIVVSKNLPFISVCEHHVFPFYGVADIAYIPNDRVVGLSKLARLLDCYAKRFQIQERMTTEIIESIEHYLKPQASAVFIKATHTCQCWRGVQKPGEMVTSELRGRFRENAEARNELMHLLER